jgi:hypothetical protein
MLLFAAILARLLRTIDIYIPPTRHCSLVIGAACHLLKNCVNAHLGEVRWGSTNEATEPRLGHGTFTSKQVASVQPGALYA